MDIKPVLSDDARRRFGEILDDVEHRGACYEVRRYRRPSAMIVPVAWARAAQAALDLAGDAAASPQQRPEGE